MCKIELNDVGIQIDKAVQQAEMRIENEVTTYSLQNSNYVKVENDKEDTFYENPKYVSVINIDEFKCLECNKVFSKENDLKKHKGCKKLKCNHCEYYTIKKVLTDRYRSTKENESYRCDSCVFSTECLKRLMSHEYDVHNNPNSKICNICGYITNRNSKLTMHMQKHNEEKRHKCNHCNYSCTRKSRLDDHINFKHYKVKSWVCDLCGRSFTRVENLREHSRIFHMPPIHKCDLCSFAIGCKKYLKRHKKKVHKTVC